MAHFVTIIDFLIFLLNLLVFLFVSFFKAQFMLATLHLIMSQTSKQTHCQFEVAAAGSLIWKPIHGLEALQFCCTLSCAILKILVLFCYPHIHTHTYTNMCFTDCAVFVFALCCLFKARNNNKLFSSFWMLFTFWVYEKIIRSKVAEMFDTFI